MLRCFTLTTATCFILLSTQLYAKSDLGGNQAGLIKSPAGEIDPSKQLSFSEASIRPSRPDELGYRLRVYPGRLTITGITVQQLVEYAFDLKPFQVRGGPSWIRFEKFDISGVTDEATGAMQVKEDEPQRNNQMRSMARDLLAGRFKLTTHHESGPGSAYRLMLAKPLNATNHPGLTSSTGSSGQNPGTHREGTYNITMSNVPIGVLVSRISDYMASPVEDQTGLVGHFDINMYWQEASATEGAALNDGDTLPGALKNQLDMKLSSYKGKVDLLVIDKVEHPSEN